MPGSTSRTRWHLLTLVTGLVWATSPHAAIDPQGAGLLDGCDESGTLTADQETACVSERRVNQRQDATVSPADVSVESRASFEASTEGQTAKFTFGTDRQKKPWQHKPQTWMVTITGKVDEKDSAALLGDLDGLNDGVSASYRYNLEWWDNLATGSRADEAQVIRREICAKDLADRRRVHEAENPGQPFTDDGRICSRSVLSGPNKETYVREWVERVETLRQFSTLSLEAKVNYAEFEYFDATSLAKTSDKETGVSVSATYAMLTASGNVVFGGARWERSYKSQDKVQQCVPGPAPGVEVCDTQPFGAPERQNKLVAYTEYRAFVGGKYAISPRVSYDFDNSKLGIRIPVWLVPNAKGSLTGGLRFDWNNDDDDVITSVFVSAPLKLLSP